MSDTSQQQLIQLIQDNKSDSLRIKLIYQLSYLNIFKAFSKVPNNANTLPWLKKGFQLSQLTQSHKWQIQFLKLTGDYYFQTMDYDNGESYYKKAINYSDQFGEKTVQGKLWLELATKMDPVAERNIQKRISYLNNAIKIFSQTGDKANAVTATNLLCNIWISQGKLYLARTELLKLLHQVQNGYYRQRSEIYESLASIDILQGNSISELTNRIESVKNIERADEPLLAAYVYLNLATTYINLGKYQNSLNWAEKCFEFLREKKYDLDNYRLSGDLIITDLLALNQPQKALNFLKKSIADFPPINYNHHLSIAEDFGNIYTALGQYQKAEISYLNMIQTMHHITRDNEKNITYANITYYVHYYKAIINFYIISHQFVKAQPYLTYVSRLPQNHISLVKRSQYFMMQFKVDSALGNYKAALHEYQLQKMLNDSLFNAGKQRELEELTLKYQTERKEQSIRLLESKNKNQVIIVEKANLQRNVTMIGIVMLLSFTVMAYRGYQIKRRSNINLQSKQIEINQQNQKLKNLVEVKDLLLYEKDKLLTEKDWLMKELHHRVKNNLQIVMSLLNTQSAFLVNRAALDAIKESQNRVQAIALIHQKLYYGNEIALVNMPTYIADLVNNLSNSFDLQHRNIRFKRLTENLNIDISQAVPIGLFINEAITNAIKYAFDDKGGQIIITFNHILDNHLILRITDNGKGMPQDFDCQTTTTLGIELMKALSKQLKGKFTIKCNRGVTVGIEFEHDRKAVQPFSNELSHNSDPA